MGKDDVLYRRTAYGVIVLLSLMIGFLAVDPYSETAVIIRIAMLVFVALLIVGILPGSYLQRRIHAASHKESVLRSRLLRVTALIAPIVGVALFSFAVYFFYSVLSQIDNTNLAVFDRGEVNFNLVRYWTLGSVSVVWLILNARTLFSKGTQRQQTSAKAPKERLTH